MAIDADAFADEYNEFNKTMNRGYRLGQWFAAEFGSTQCRALTQCDFATVAGVSRYIDGDAVARCRAIAARVAQEVDRVIEAHSRGGQERRTTDQGS